MKGAKVEYEKVAQQDEEQGAKPEKAISLTGTTSTAPSKRSQILSFAFLVVIQGSHVLVFKTSQKEGSYAYNTASAICTTELIKFLLSACFHFFSRGDGPLIPSINAKEFVTWSILALCYCINNQLTFWLLIFLGPGQLSLGKSFSPMLTAVLLWQIYNESINKIQWSCLILVVAGLINVLYSKKCPKLDPNGVEIESINENDEEIFGSALLFISCMITAFSSVFNARMLQKGDLPLNVQNALLYSQGFVFNLIAYNLGFTPSKVTGFFTGYDDINVMLVLLSQSLMGIAISLVYKYGGAVVKTLATGAQAALLTIADGMFFGVPLGPGKCEQLI